jgi:hypothetical protein
LVRAAAGLAVLGGLIAVPGPASANGHGHGHGRGDPALPIVFVHGATGSGAQYETQAMRFASNGYPNVVEAIDRISATAEVIQPILDQFFDKVMADNDDEQIYVVAHSQGVAVMNAYLNSSPARAARVAKYIGIDSASGLSPDACPGGVDEDGNWLVPCMGVWGRGDPARRLGTNANVQFADQGHVQVVGSPESFAAQYRFLTGRDARTTDIVPQRGRVEISGRAINYPANTALAGAVVEVWPVDAATGARRSRRPIAHFDIGEDGNWGPATVSPKQHYEIAVTRQTPDGPRYQHNYYEPFPRDDRLVRLNLSPTDSALAQAIGRNANHSVASIVRQKEWWGDAPGDADTLRVSTTRKDGTGQPAVNVINAATASVSGNPIGVITFDDGDDGVSHPDQLIPRLGAFLTGVDVYYPAADPTDGTITFDADQRGVDAPQVLHTPNWGSDRHGITVNFWDWVLGAPVDR